MKRAGGEEEHGLTRGGLTETPSKLGNLSCEGKLTRQKSAEAVVRATTRERPGRAEQSRKNETCTFIPDDEADNLKEAYPKEEVVNPLGTSGGWSQGMAQTALSFAEEDIWH